MADAATDSNPSSNTPVRLEGASNFRDLGGHLGFDGRRVRWRRLYRSDHLGALSEADRRTLSALEVRRSFDFRGVDESAAAPYRIDGLTRHALTIEPSVVQGMQALEASGRGLDGNSAAELMNDLYRNLIDHQSHRFAELFNALLDDGDGALVFHCTAGKDRTGVAAALILAALGVPRDAIEADFLRSNALFRRPDTHATTLPDDVLAVLWQVQPRYLATALDTIDRHHGGVENYLHQRLGLDSARRAALVDRYLLPD